MQKEYKTNTPQGVLQMWKECSIDKQKHVNEFRLRILTTNKCDKSCLYCLNDFQKKGDDFISPEFVEKHVTAYVEICKHRNIRPVISISGGEPGLHPDFVKILYMCVSSGARVQVNSNGLIDDSLFDHYSVDIRYHMGHDLRNKIVPAQTAVFIIQEKYTFEETRDFIRPFHLGGMRIKTFADYNGSGIFRTITYPAIIEYLKKDFPVSARHTGIQENRGNGCNGCANNCVTLKALWLFPDNTSSFCPQRAGELKTTIQAVEGAYEKHLVFNQLK